MGEEKVRTRGGGGKNHFKPWVKFCTLFCLFISNGSHIVEIPLLLFDSLGYFSKHLVSPPTAAGLSNRVLNSSTSALYSCQLHFGRKVATGCPSSG